MARIEKLRRGWMGEAGSGGVGAASSYDSVPSAFQDILFVLACSCLRFFMRDDDLCLCALDMSLVLGEFPWSIASGVFARGWELRELMPVTQLRA